MDDKCKNKNKNKDDNQFIDNGEKKIQKKIKAMGDMSKDIMEEVRSKKQRQQTYQFLSYSLNFHSKVS